MNIFDSMRRVINFWVLSILLSGATGYPASAQSGIDSLSKSNETAKAPSVLNGKLHPDARISKVLPHFLDRDGKHTLWPSLYERDAYQAHLRKTPEERSGLRLDILWKAKKVSSAKLVLRAELRGLKGKEMQTLI